MKIFLNIIFFFSFVTLSYTQDKGRYTSFLNEEGLEGFYDESGKIVIEPVFENYTLAHYWDDIISVIELDEKSYDTYFLTKNGEKKHHDSLYFFDNAPDCESEGFIRFRVQETDKAGMLNANGDISIPAIYSDILNARNGYVIALKDAVKKYWHGDKENDGCNHYSWDGGTEYLLDTSGKVIIENFNDFYSLNIYSIKIEDKEGKDKVRRYFKGVDGSFYSFIDYEIEFKEWINKKFIPALSSKEELRELVHPEIVCWDEEEKCYVRIDRDSYLLSNYNSIINMFKNTDVLSADHPVFF
ncbi:MAG: WG repeat-containing protein, partial [Flavobacteriaceae bacterium]|nr:WG repeat-containing protein [Flavobacteriaceae bacterium]